MKSNLADKILTVFFPRRCAVCGKVIFPDEVVCDNCDIEKHRIPYPKCNKCGQAEDFCNCGADKLSFEHIITPFYYEGDIRTCIKNFKFKGYYDNGKFLAGEMVRTFEEEYVFEKPDLIVPVPMTKRRKRRRGFSQTDTLARRISEATGIEFSNELLRKTRETPPQVGLDAKERRNNLVNAFAVSENENLKGKTIIVCDDTKTTGTTLHECAKALKRAGAKKVIGLTAALTKNDFRGEAY